MRAVLIPRSEWSEELQQQIVADNKRISKQCPYLGEPIPDDIVELKVLCNTCGGKITKHITHTIHKCQKLGRCNPRYTCNRDAIGEVLSGTDAIACNSCLYNPTVISSYRRSWRKKSPELAELAEKMEWEAFNLLIKTLENNALQGVK